MEGILGIVYWGDFEVYLTTCAGDGSSGMVPFGGETLDCLWGGDETDWRR